MMETILEWWPVALAVANLIGGPALLWHLSKRFAAKKDHDQLAEALTRHVSGHVQTHADLDRRLAQGEREFAAIKADIEHLPTKEDIEVVNKGIAGLTATVSALDATVRGVDKAIGGLQETVSMLLQNELRQGQGVKG